ncbi:MAG TPA: hypothetical protein DCY51_11255 [Bacteroidetes bacterium]|nr:hypothetical protein [Bacteroidota bacterium]
MTYKTNTFKHLLQWLWVTNAASYLLVAGTIGLAIAVHTTVPYGEGQVVGTLGFLAVTLFAIIRGLLLYDRNLKLARRFPATQQSDKFWNIWQYK